MRSTSLDMDSWVLGFQQPSSLLDIASTIKKYTIDTSAKWIKLQDPWIKQACNECGILLATLNKMVSTCCVYFLQLESENDNNRIGECGIKFKINTNKNLQSAIKNMAQGSPTPEASMFISGIP